MARTAKQKAATKRMIAANRAARGISGATRPRKKGKKSAARSRSATLAHAEKGYHLVKAPKGASDKARLSALEHNQVVLGRGLSVVADEVMEHRKALIGGGLLTARGKALGKGGR